MHELSLAQSLADEIVKVMERENAKEVIKVTVKIGALSGVDPDAFKFAVPFAFQGTVLEKTELLLDESPVTVKCRKCGEESNPEPIMMQCLKCGSDDIDIISGREFLISSMEVK